MRPTKNVILWWMKSEFSELVPSSEQTRANDTCLAKTTKTRLCISLLIERSRRYFWPAKKPVQTDIQCYYCSLLNARTVSVPTHWRRRGVGRYRARKRERGPEEQDTAQVTAPTLRVNTLSSVRTDRQINICMLSKRRRERNTIPYPERVGSFDVA